MEPRYSLKEFLPNHLHLRRKTKRFKSKLMMPSTTHLNNAREVHPKEKVCYRHMSTPDLHWAIIRQIIGKVKKAVTKAAAKRNKKLTTRNTITSAISYLKNLWVDLNHRGWHSATIAKKQSWIKIFWAIKQVDRYHESETNQTGVASQIENQSTLNTYDNLPNKGMLKEWKMQGLTLPNQ